MVGARGSAPRRVLILAGEASGDVYGGQLAAELRRRWPGIELVGIGGERMAAAGARLLHTLDELAVMGLVEVARRLSFFRRLERRIVGVMTAGTDLVVPIDFPGLNLRIADHAKRAGVPVLYYVGPQVWAWRKRRARRLARAADRIAVILPFEAPIYEAWGGRVTFVGHPLLDEPQGADPPRLRRELGLDANRPVLALFPGSRAQEIDRLLDPFTRAAKELTRRLPGLQTVVAKAPALPWSAYQGAEHPVTEDGISLRRLGTAGVVKSGTGTLEAALAGMPMCVAYATHPLTYLVARSLVRVSHIALPNLILGRRVVPELVQSDVGAQAIADAVEPLLDPDSPVRETMVGELSEVRGALARPGAASRVADLVAEIVEERQSGRVGG